MSYRVKCSIICKCGKEGPNLICDGAKIPRDQLATLALDNGFTIFQGEPLCAECYNDRFQLPLQSGKRIKVGMVGDSGGAGRTVK